MLIMLTEEEKRGGGGGEGEEGRGRRGGGGGEGEEGRRGGARLIHCSHWRVEAGGRERGDRQDTACMKSVVIWREVREMERRGSQLVGLKAILHMKLEKRGREGGR